MADAPIQQLRRSVGDPVAGVEEHQLLAHHVLGPDDVGIGSAGQRRHDVTLGHQAQLVAAPPQDDTLERLKELGELKASGVLTDAEFEAQKAKILAGM